MASTRRTLDEAGANLEESMGVRSVDFRPVLSPAPTNKDAGRRPLRNVGRVLIAKVIPDTGQPRVEFSDEALGRLAFSIREKGQYSPIRVRWSDDLQKWVIISGERRWRAAQRAGLKEIDCYFHEGDLDASEILEQQLIENCLREDLQPIEEARAFASLMKLNGWTGKQVAESLRVHPSRVSRGLALLELPNEIQEKVASGQVSARSAYEISKLSNPETQVELATKAAVGELTHGQAVGAVRQRQGKSKPAPRTTKLTFDGDDGWKVIVSAPRKGNYFEVEQALMLALDEVRLRIKSGCHLS